MSGALRFPEGFLWGAATSAHQVEGGQDNDWTEWERRGKIRDGSVSGRACDQWNRYEEDFEMAKALEHNAHRLSLEWSRIEPRAEEWDESALQHYRDVVQALRQRGLEPFVTLWHFTNPRWLAERGGWEWPEAPARFARYAERVARALPDVRFWTTVNESNVYALLGYVVGEWPPEVKRPLRAYRVFRNLAAAHRAAYRAIKHVRQAAQVGPAINFVYFQAKTDALLSRWMKGLADDWYNRRWLSWIDSTADWIGVNHYVRTLISFGSLFRPMVQEQGPGTKTDFGWEIFPEAMYRALKLVNQFGKPIYITENGLADSEDRWRRQFLHDYLRQVHRAILNGINVRGYFYWSLLDNFEWREGFNKRFGLIEVDFKTQQRRIRPSAEYYAQICRANALEV